MGIQLQLGQTEWWPAETLAEFQFRQIDQLVQHARRTVPYYRETFDAAGIPKGEPFSPQRWAEVPLLSREALQDRGEDLLSRTVPKSHGQTSERKTSGSSGRQIVVSDTQLHQIYWHANTLREHLWHKRDSGGRFVSIRSGRSADNPLLVRDSANWGMSVGMVFATGPATKLFQRMPIEQQAKELVSRDPAYLMAYPSNVARLARYFREHDLLLPGLKQVLTYGETMLPETRPACREAWGVGVADMYSCEEAGYIALQCPDSDNYHCQSESILVEVLDDDGRPCKPGEIGRVVLTVLHNFAMPLIRYENLDYAEVGPPCVCGRGLPVIKRILGRKRNRARALDGNRFWPELAPGIWSGYTEIDELQLVQDGTDHVELRMVAGQPLGSARERDLTQALGHALGQPYRFSVRYQDETLRHANGKYERFICQV